jgi:hypothetical protein
MSDSIDGLRTAIAEFVLAFEVVFRYDWPYTLMSVGNEADGANFIEPGVADEHEDWASRGCLLEKYRQLVRVMKERGIEPIFPYPLDRIPGFTEMVW